MQHSPRTQLCRFLRGVYYERDSITNWQRGAFTITHKAGNAFLAVPDLFGQSNTYLLQVLIGLSSSHTWQLFSVHLPYMPLLIRRGRKMQ